MVKGCNKDNHSQDLVTEVTLNDQTVVKDPNIFSPQNDHHLLAALKIYLQQKNIFSFSVTQNKLNPSPTSLFSPGFFRCVDRRLERGLRRGSSRHMSEGRRGGAGRKQVKDHTEVGRGGVTSSVNVGRGGVTVWEICAVLA